MYVHNKVCSNSLVALDDEWVEYAELVFFLYEPSVFTLFNFKSMYLQDTCYLCFIELPKFKLTHLHLCYFSHSFYSR